MGAVVVVKSLKKWRAKKTQVVVVLRHKSFCTFL